MESNERKRKNIALTMWQNHRDQHEQGFSVLSMEIGAGCRTGKIDLSKDKEKR